MSSGGTFVDRIDPFAKRSLKKKQRKSQGSSRYRTGGDVELTPLPLLKGKSRQPPRASRVCQAVTRDDSVLVTHVLFSFNMWFVSGSNRWQEKTESDFDKPLGAYVCM
jgi:hypothetical protein